MAPARAPGDVTLARGVEMICAARETTDVLRWICVGGLQAFSPSLRKCLLGELARRDPGYAGGVYLWRADLTDEEDALLYAAFAPEMPALVERVARSPECRAKVRARRG